MSRAEGGIDDVDDEFTREAKQAANAHAAEEDLAQEESAKGKSPKAAAPEDGAKTASSGKGASTKKASDSVSEDGAAASEKSAAAKKKAAAKGAASTDTADGESTEDKAASKRSRREKKPPKVASGLNPTWWVPVMVGLMVIGLIWIVVFYLSGAKYPVPGIDYWNLAIGFVLLLAGFAMTTRWK